MSRGRLTDVSGGDEGAVYLFEDVCELGRGATSHVRVSGPTVSRLQARILRTGARFEIQHLGSSSRTLVNDQPFNGTRPLFVGDLVRVGDRTLRFDGLVPDAPRLPAEGPSDEDTVMGDPMGSLKIVRSLSSSFSLLDLEARESTPRLERLTSALKTISGVARRLAAILDVDELLLEIPARVIDVFSAARAAILVKDAGGALTPRAVKHKDARDLSALHVSKTVLLHVTEKREAVISRDAGVDSRFAGGVSLVASGACSIMCAPLIWREELVGAIYLDSNAVGAFSDPDLELLVGIADQCATALGIAQLHREMTHRQLVEQDLRVAQKIQKSFLPRSTPEVPGMTFATSYQPARHVGGDFYDFIPLGPGRLAMIIGDISGKGIGAALHMARVSRDIRFLAAADPDPHLFATELNRLVNEAGHSTMFVTLLYVVVDARSRTMTVANCGHLPPVIRRARASAAELIELEAGNAIGLLPDGEFGRGEIRLEPGDTILFYTDGLTEAMSPKKELLGTERVLAALSGGSNEPSVMVHRALALIQRHAAGAAASDDTTLLAVGVDGAPKRARGARVASERGGRRAVAENPTIDELD